MSATRASSCAFSRSSVTMASKARTRAATSPPACGNATSRSPRAIWRVPSASCRIGRDRPCASANESGTESSSATTPASTRLRRVAASGASSASFERATTRAAIGSPLPERTGTARTM